MKADVSENAMIVAVVLLCFVFGWCGDGIRVQCGANVIDTHAADAGAR